MEERLFKDFAGVSRDEWQNKIIADLRGKPIEGLNWEVAGLTGGPVYTKENLPEELADVANGSDQPGIFGARHWVNYQLIEVTDDKSANQQALAALNAGADGIIFRLKSAAVFETLLADINGEYCHLSFVDESADPNAPEAFLSYLESSRADLSRINGFYKGTASVRQVSQKLAQYKLLNIESARYTDNSPVKEIASTLAKTASVLDGQTEAGLAISTLFNQLQFELSLGTSYFTEIAKYRAMRALAVRFASAYEVELSAGDINILASTGTWTEPIDDPHSYMLRATTEAMAAILGGTDALCIQPFYHVFEQDQKALAERSARNISNILKEESYFNKVIDPSSGSYFVESLTRDIMDQSWQLFLEIEAAGGSEALTAEKIESLHQNLTADEA